MAYHEKEQLVEGETYTDNDSDSDPPRQSLVGKTWNRYAAEGYTFVHNNNNKSDGESDKRRSKSDRQLCVLLVLCILIIIGLLVALIVVNTVNNRTVNFVRKYHTSAQNQNSEICMSPDCVIVSGKMLSKMDLSHDPCEDFFEYACSRAVHDPLIPPEVQRWSVFTEVEKRNNAIVKRLLDVPGNKYKDVNSTAVQKAKAHYNTCMNISATEAISNDRLLEVIKDLGSWPLLNNSVAGTWDESTWDFERSLGRTFWYGQAAFFDSGVGTDDKNSTYQRIVFDQAGTSMTHTYYMGNDTDKYKEAFMKFFVTVATLLGADKAESTTAAQNVWDLETAIAKAFDKPEDRVDPLALYNLMTVSDLQAMIGSSVNLSRYLKEVYHQSIPDTQQVLVFAPNYMKKMATIITTATASDKKLIANYVVWRVVSSFVSVMPLPYRLALQELKTALVGVTGTGELWERCLQSTNGLLGFVTGALFVEKQFSAQDKVNVLDVLKNIRETFKASLPDVSWMDEATRTRSIEKAEAIIEKIGYPEFIMDPKKLDERYEKLNVTEDSPFDNHLNSIIYAIQRNVDKLGKPTNKDEWEMAPAEVNAYYSSVGNEMVFPAGILQMPFYDKILPKSLLYGALGVVMGHELTHAFDNQGRLYDIHGNLNNWWTNQSAIQFLNKSECLVDEYSEFVVQGEHMNGKTTLGENIADNGGLKTSYNAFHSLIASSGYVEPTMPGLNATQDQLFFLGFAQLWCTYSTPEYAKQSLITDVHSNAKYRVIGTLRNSPQFSEAYQCSPDSKMNPSKKCSLW